MIPDFLAAEVARLKARNEELEDALATIPDDGADLLANFRDFILDPPPNATHAAMPVAMAARLLALIEEATADAQRSGERVGRHENGCEHEAWESKHAVELTLVKAERDQALTQVADYENRICWHTTCQQCATVLDRSIADYERAERLTAEADRLRDAWQQAWAERNQARDTVAAVRDLAGQWAGEPTTIDRYLANEILKTLDETNTTGTTTVTTRIFICPGCTRTIEPSDQGVTWGPGGILWCSEDCFAGTEAEHAALSAALDGEDRREP